MRLVIGALIAIAMAACAQVVGADFDDYHLASNSSGGGGAGHSDGGAGGGSPALLSVLLLEASGGGAPPLSDALVPMLADDPRVGTVEALTDLDSTTPGAEALAGFDVVVFTSVGAPENPTALGDLLAAHVNNGGRLILGRGGVCFPEGENMGSTLGPLGAVFEPLRTLVPGALAFSGTPLTVVPDSGSPLLEGTQTLMDQEFCQVTVASGAMGLAHWSNGAPLVAVRSVAGELRIDINARPDSAPARQLYLNAITAPAPN